MRVPWLRPICKASSKPKTQASLAQRQLVMSLRKNFDSFTAEHKLHDAQEEFAHAVYRFRAAEKTNSPDLIDLKREMEFLDRKVAAYRHNVYSGLPIEEYIEWPALPDRCPKPAWG